VAELVQRLQDALRGRYAIERELGAGGMATVYLARDLRHDRPVALKVLRAELSESLGPERFEREIRMAARLQHPHILSVHDSGTDAGLLWYTMPYVEGESLRDRLRREAQLPLEDALRITREVADALGYAHAQGIVHRDIKPENILLSGGHALVADFGVARALGGEAGLTETGMSVGTPSYMSPEQSLADPRLDGRSDIYSLGSVLYEMLVGETPYTGPTAQAVIAKRLHDPVPSARRLRETVPVPVDRALQRAMAKSAADRFPTVGAFSSALAAGAEGETPRSGAGGGATGALGGRRRVAIALGVAAVVALAALPLLRRDAARHPEPTTANAAVRRIAVLPFENLGDAADGYFADGVADAVRGKLTELPGIEVIARGSSVPYAGSKARPDDIARDLGVRYLLTGTVRWAKQAGVSRVQVAPELVGMRDNAAPTTEWSESFDAPLTDVFQVQADIASRVAQALGVRLGGGQARQLIDRPTEDVAAYDAYLRAEAFTQRMELLGTDAADSAIKYYREAVARDSGFARAWAKLAGAQSVNFINSGRPTGKAAPIHAMLARVERLAPDAPETAYLRAQVAYNVDADTAKAFAAIRDALAHFPTTPKIVEFAGVLEFQVGRFERALAYTRRGLELDPKSSTLVFMGSMSALMARRYAEARTLIDRFEQMQPESPDPPGMRVASYLGEGDVAAARRALADAQARLPAGRFALMTARWVSAPWLLDAAQRRQMLAQSKAAFDGFTAARALFFSDIKLTEGDTVAARRWADSTLAALPEDERLLGKGNPQLLAGRAAAEARLGRLDSAVAHARHAVRASEADRIGFIDPAIRLAAAQVFLQAGLRDEAVAKLEEVLDAQYMVSAAWLAIEPRLTALRGYPPFDRLIAGH
jgi:serine/threonine-protein kinase